MLNFESYTVKKNLILKFSGFYPPGSAGNKHAQFIAETVTSYLNKDKPEDKFSGLPLNIILDFSELEYMSGDAIAGVALPFIKHNRSLSIFATGKTKLALLHLAQLSILSSKLIKISDHFEELMVK